MIWGVLILSGVLTAAQHARTAPEPRSEPANGPAIAADRITLRDGSPVFGLVTSVTGGPKGAVDLIVRREWARQHLPKWAPRWERNVESGLRQATRQRIERLAAWQVQRAIGRPEDDRILAWIDRERKRLEDPRGNPPSTLLPVHLTRGEIRAIDRRPPGQARLLQLGWLCGLPDVEALTLDALRDALEGRGFSPDGENTPSLDGLLPPTPEPEVTWLARRAATELAIDPDLRYVRHRTMVFPDPGARQGGEAPGLGEIGLPAVLGELRQLLDPDSPREDPLVAVFKKIGESGRAGAVVTRLDIPEDLRHAAVEATLWVRLGPERWVPFVSRSSVARPEAIPQDAGRDLAEDPQVKTAFSLVEALGLGKVAPEIKDRSLKMGAATQAALGEARAALSHDLNRLSLPIFEPGGETPAPVSDRSADRPPARDTAGPGPSGRASAPGGSRPAP
ncbi:MAG: hypothetical protein U0790_20355 [Isosphaeraceae bacterium]